jgi:hypothetical protein
MSRKTILSSLILFVTFLSANHANANDACVNVADGKKVEGVCPFPIGNIGATVMVSCDVCKPGAVKEKKWVRSHITGSMDIGRCPDGRIVTLTYCKKEFEQEKCVETTGTDCRSGVTCTNTAPFFRFGKPVSQLSEKMLVWVNHTNVRDEPEFVCKINPICPNMLPLDACPAGFGPLPNTSQNTCLQIQARSGGDSVVKWVGDPKRGVCCLKDFFHQDGESMNGSQSSGGSLLDSATADMSAE